MEFTADQQKIIDSRNKNLLVSAAAGSGKTTVLVERIMSMVTDRDDPCDIGEILVVTFTRAAAANMKNKIAEAFRKRIEREGPDPRLSRQAILVHSAKIMTLDTFCLSVIRDHFPETGLDPAFRVAADGEANLIKKDVYASVMEDRYLSDDNEDFLDMCEAFSAGKDDSGVERIVEKLYNVAESYPWPVKWLEEHGAAYDENDPLVIEFTAEKVLSMLRRARNVLSSALEICDLPGGPEPYRDAIETVIASIDRASVSFSKNGAWDPSAIETITFPKRAQVRGNAYSPELKERCSAEWKKAATIVKNAVKTALPLSEGTSADPVCAEHLKSLTELTIDFIEAYAAEKEKRGVIDFSDMGHLALRILARENEDGTIEPTDTALEYRKIFREVMCDEYQDSNLVQEIILSAIAGKDPEVCSRFMVGDVKQSIYGFRQARPELFVEKYEEYGRNEDGNDQRIILSENFRSRRSVTNSVNRVFRYIMKKEMGGVEYDEDAELKQAASFPEADSPDNVTEILIADKGDEDMDSSEAESILIADTIEDLKKRLQIYDSKLEDMRPLKYGDIAILIRSFSHVGAIRETLEGRDIPVSVSTSSGYFSVIEVRNLMNFLTAIGNPLDDIALFGVMRGPLGGFRDEELAQMKAGSSEASFWETVLRYSKAGEDPLREKVSAFISMLNGYRASSVYTGVSDILRRIINETGYREMISSMRGGERRLANVQMLIKRAEEFEGTSYFGVHDFVRYIDEMRKYDIDFGEADTEGEESDAVRIMSIHKSKGLEFPVVFLAFSANKFNDMDTFGKVVVSSEYGAGMDHIDTEKRIFYPTIRKDMIVSRVKETMHGEEMRLLYTAMTRAKEKLIITGCMKEAEKNLNNAPGFTAAPGSAADTGDIESANNYLSWLMLTPVIKLAEAVMITKKDDEGDPDAYHATLRERRAMVMSYGEADKGIYDAAVKAFEYTYPHPELRGVFSKTTVTELKRQSLLEEGESAESLFEEKREEEMTFPVPLFMEGEERPAAGNIRGTAYHRVMAVIDPMASSVEEDILRLEREGLISPEQRRLVKTKDIEAFVQSELFGRMKEAYKKGKLKREQPFVSFAHGSDEAGKEKTNAIMQGMIDAMWEEDGGVVILDYKTDRVSTMAELEERYRFQLELYGEAIGREKKIKSLVLYSFHLDKVQEL